MFPTLLSNNFLGVENYELIFVGDALLSYPMI